MRKEIVLQAEDVFSAGFRGVLTPRSGMPWMRNMVRDSHGLMRPRQKLVRGQAHKSIWDAYDPESVVSAYVTFSSDPSTDMLFLLDTSVTEAPPRAMLTNPESDTDSTAYPHGVPLGDATGGPGDVPQYAGLLDYRQEPFVIPGNKVLFGHYVFDCNRTENSVDQMDWHEVTGFRDWQPIVGGTPGNPERNVPIWSVWHQGRAFFWHDIVTTERTIPGYRIVYSAPYDAATLQGYLDVDGEIGGCVPTGSALLIWTTDSRWYSLEGVGDPEDMFLTFMGMGPIPGQYSRPIVVEGGVVFINRNGLGLISLTSDGEFDKDSNRHLAFDEADVAEGEYTGVDAYPAYPPTTDPTYDSKPMIYNPNTQEIFAPGQGRSFLYFNGKSWSAWLTEIEAPTYITAGDVIETYRVLDRERNILYFWCRDEDGALQLLGYRAEGDDVGESGSGLLQIPIIADPGFMVRIDRVTVEGMYDSTGVDDGRGVTVTVKHADVETVTQDVALPMALGDAPSATSQPYFNQFSIVGGSYQTTAVVEIEATVVSVERIRIEYRLSSARPDSLGD